MLFNIPMQALSNFPPRWVRPMPLRQVNIAMPSVQSLHLEFRFDGAHGSTSISVATGFVCNSPAGPVLITNWHNVAGIDPITGKHLSKATLAEPNRVAISHNGPSLGSFVVRVEKLRDEKETPLWIEHPRWGRTADMVALKLTDLNGVQLHPYATDKDADLAVGVSEVVSVVGFPFGLRAGGMAIWATGTVASEPPAGYREIDRRRHPGGRARQPGP